MNYSNELVERIIMDLGSNILELENAMRNNHGAVKREISSLYDSQKSLNHVVGRIIAGAV